MDKEIKPGDDVVERASKLIPAEALAAYTAITGILLASGMSKEHQEWAIAIVAILILVLLPFFQRHYQSVRDNVQHGVSMLSFFFYVLTVHYYELPRLGDIHTLLQAVGPAGTTFMTFIVPLLMKKSQ